MSSELLHPRVDPLGPGGIRFRRGDDADPSRTVVDDAAFAVDWQVRPAPVEPEERRPAPRVPASARTPGFSFDVARALGTVVVTAQGVLDHAGARALRHVLDDLIENQGNMAVVVDLHGVTDVDPGCLDVFVSAHGWAVIRGAQLSLSGARSRLARALDEAGVSRLVKVTPDRILAVPASTPAGFG